MNALIMIAIIFGVFAVLAWIAERLDARDRRLEREWHREHRTGPYAPPLDEEEWSEVTRQLARATRYHVA